AMHRAVIDAGNRVSEPTLKLVNRHRRGLLRVQVSLGTHVRECGAGQQMHLTHHRADEPLNMAAVMRGADGSIVDGDPVLLADATQRLGSELLGVVEMQPAQEAM